MQAAEYACSLKILSHDSLMYSLESLQCLAVDLSCLRKIATPGSK